MLTYDLSNAFFKYMLRLVNFYKNDQKANAAVPKFTCSNDIKATLNQNKSQTHDSNDIKNIQKKS